MKIDSLYICLSLHKYIYITILLKMFYIYMGRVLSIGDKVFIDIESVNRGIDTTW